MLFFFSLCTDWELSNKKGHFYGASDECPALPPAFKLTHKDLVQTDPGLIPLDTATSWTISPIHLWLRKAEPVLIDKTSQSILSSYLNWQEWKKFLMLHVNTYLTWTLYSWIFFSCEIREKNVSTSERIYTSGITVNKRYCLKFGTVKLMNSNKYSQGWCRCAIDWNWYAAVFMCQPHLSPGSGASSVNSSRLQVKLPTQRRPVLWGEPTANDTDVRQLMTFQQFQDGK